MTLGQLKDLLSDLDGLNEMAPKCKGKITDDCEVYITCCGSLAVVLKSDGCEELLHIDIDYEE